MPPLINVHVIGASGRSGASLCRALATAGVAVVPVVRSAARWAATGLPETPRLADLTRPDSLVAALRDGENIVSCAHARHAAAILHAAPPAAKFVFLGSTRKFTRWPDAHGNGVLAGEAAFLASGRRGVMLHPTMIYGAQGENNVRRLAALLKKLPLVPLPNGGRALVQPIHQDDLTACIHAALVRDWESAETIVVAGPAALPYADFVRAVADAFGLPPPRVVPVPAALLRLAASVLFMLPITPDEIRRLTEDKAFSIDAMQHALGVSPRTLGAGLALMT